METVIAKPKKSLIASYIILIVFGAIFAIIGVAALIFSDEPAIGAFLLSIGLLVMGAGIGWTVYFARLPKNYITFSEGKLRFYNGLECSPAEIDYCTASTWGLDGAIFNYGKLTMSVRSQELKFKFVVDVNAVSIKLNALKTECAAVESMKKYIDEKKAAETAETAVAADGGDKENTQG